MCAYWGSYCFSIIQSFLDIMIDMENQQRLREDDLEELRNILGKCDQQLVCSLEKFKNGHRNQEQSHEVSM